MTAPLEAVLPRYFAGSLAEVLPSAVAALGVDEFANTLNFPASRAFVVLLVDGLGWELLRQHAEQAPYLTSLLDKAQPLTSGVPSTTATSLTTLGTGLPPGAHGVVGYTCRIPGTLRLLDALRWDKSIDPRQWQPHPTVFARAAAAGISATAVLRRAFLGSGLTEAGQRGSRFVAADTAGERIASVVECSRTARSLTYAYAGELDATGHRRGCESDAWRQQLGVTDCFIAALRSALPADVALVVTADHGMVDVPLDRRLEVDDEPELMSGVSLLGGEARLRHLYCVPGAAAEVAARWRERCAELAWVVTLEEAIDEGWFGSVDDAVRPRLGDVVVASKGISAVVSRSRFPAEETMVGLHGSLTSEEMLVPVLVDVAG